MPNLHRQFRDALLKVDVAIPGDGESVASKAIELHEGRKADGQEIQIRFPKLLNLADGKQIRVWFQHSDTGQESVNSQGLKPPGGVNPPDELPSKPPKRDPKPDPETPKDPKKDPEKDPKPEDPGDGPDSTPTWERALNVGLAVVTGPQLVATAQYLAVPVEIKEFVRAVVSVDKDAGNNTGLIEVSLVF